MSSSDKAGWTHDEYGPLVGVHRSTLYALPKELRPESIKIRGKRVIVEHPKDYLRRLAAAQKATETAGSAE